MPLQPVICTLHDVLNCLKCMPPDEYFRWQIEHDQISIFYLPDYWARRDQRSGR